jgi:hypothetical protein
VLAKSVSSWGLTIAAVGLSTLYFKRSMHNHGITIHWRS